MTHALLVEPYTPALRREWDAFVDGSRNGTFLFRRDYLEYHADRFVDHSLVVRHRGAVVALLPANLRGSTLESHGGLTFGGLLSDGWMTTLRMSAVLEALVAHLRERRIERLVYRAVPHIYHSSPSEEDLFALGRAGARLARRAALAVLEPQSRVRLQERRKRALARAGRSGLTVRESDDLEGYWALLGATLGARYNAAPVHSASEIRLLKERFPANIRLFGCFRDGLALAGVLVYESRQVARAQYIAASEEGREAGALDLVFEVLLREVFHDKRYFDLGTSEGKGCCGLNEGVIEFKEGLGARTVALDTYELALGEPDPAPDAG